MVTSSFSGARLIEKAAIQSVAGTFCAPGETKRCMWSGRKYHPDDLRVCKLPRVRFHFEFATSGSDPHLRPLDELLQGVRRASDEPDRWEDIATKASTALHGGRCRVETAHFSPDRRHLAICSEVRTLLGLRIKQAGMLYSWILDETRRGN
jgi:hypothetical protein